MGRSARELHRGKVPPWRKLSWEQFTRPSHFPIEPYKRPTPTTGNANPVVPPTDGRCRLLELPPELRNHVYELVVKRDDAISMRPLAWDSEGKPITQLTQPALSATCWEVRKEVLSLYYACNTFEQTFEIGGWIEDDKSFGAYLDAVGPQLCRRFTRIRILFVFRVYPDPAPLLPWLELFCRRNAAMPATGVFEIECVQKPIEGRWWNDVHWLDDLMKHLELLGYSMYETDKRMPRPLPRTSVDIKCEMYYWLSTCQRQEFGGIVRQLCREAQIDTQKKTQLEVQWVGGRMKKWRGYYGNQ